MKEKKTELHFFFLTDYEKEEVFLRKRALQGWRMEKSAGYVYTFRRAEPEDIVYRIDFNSLRKEDRETYLQLYQDYGWTFLDENNDFAYFCKKADGTADDDLDLFSDGASKSEMLGRIFRRKMIPILILGVIYVLLMGYSVSGDIQNGFSSVWGIVGTGVSIAIIVLYVMLLAHLILGFRRLQAKYNSESQG